MKLSEVLEVLKGMDTLSFKLPDGSTVPSHFHVTEVGKISKHFIDCGGTERVEEVVNFQLYYSTDYDHRLHPEKLVRIIQLSQERLNIPDVEVEVEYQGVTIQKFNLGLDGNSFELLTKATDCLAKDNCGIPEQRPEKRRIRISELSTCDPNSNCC